MIAQMRERMFARLDGDGDGQIDLAALTEELESESEVDPGKERFLENLRAADADGDGYVSQEEFESMEPPPPPAGGQGGEQTISAEKLAEMQDRLFTELDSDGDGQIDLAELEAELDGAGRTDSLQERFLEALKAADADGDGKVTKDEFASMQPPPRPTGSSANSIYGQDAEIVRSMDGSGSLLDLCG